MTLIINVEDLLRQTGLNVYILKHTIMSYFGINFWSTLVDGT